MLSVQFCIWFEGQPYRMNYVLFVDDTQFPQYKEFIFLVT